MCKIMEEVRQEGRKEGRLEGKKEGIEIGIQQGLQRGAENNRNQMIDVLLMTNNEDTLLHNEMFKGLRITPEEISASKLRLNAKAF